ncbi:Protein tyrosine phosphatase type IVA 1 [Thoreauomyces humboldtii]|nr:Protein tyrosine phosphatase type IVA 1 [Thoreauomyces humboldtii]
MSPVTHNHLRFLILDCPTATTLPLYHAELVARNVTDVIRLCEPTYDARVLTDSNINVHDWPFKDGGIPPPALLSRFLALCEERFGGWTVPKGWKEEDGKTGPVIAVHCVAGLGRAPVLVTAALVESGAMTPLDAVEYVRRRRRGALNSVQLAWIVDSYKRQSSSSASRVKASLPHGAMPAFFSKRSASASSSGSNSNAADASSGTPTTTVTVRSATPPVPSPHVSLIGRMFQLGRKSNNGNSAATANAAAAAAAAKVAAQQVQVQQQHATLAV